MPHKGLQSHGPTAEEERRKQSLPAVQSFPIPEAKPKPRPSIDKPTEKPTIAPKLDPVKNAARIRAGNALIRRREKLINQGLTEREALAQAAAEQEGQSFEQRTQEQVTEARGEVQQQFEEEGVFKEIVQEPIISPEQENLGVIARIANNLLGGAFDTSKGILGDKTALEGTIFAPDAEPIPQAGITTIEKDLEEGIRTETLAQIDVRIDETETILIENGIPLAAAAGGAIIGAALIAPIKEFVASDGQIASLELALSQYNEMLTIPSRSLDAGLTPTEAFDKYNRMEEGMLALESELRRAALTSTKVGLALRGRGVDARLIKLKEKLQEGRRNVANKILQEGFGEVDILQSLVFLRSLQNERKKK